jgi:citrate lyase alpha subunit
MKQAGVKARFVRGGSTKYLVELLEEGLTDYILDGQTFDLDGVRSIGSNPRHVATSPLLRITITAKAISHRWWMRSCSARLKSIPTSTPT